MAERKPVVLVSGQLKEMPSTDFLPAANIPEVTAAHIHAATSKTTPDDADELGLSDSAASWGLKKLTFANLAAWVRNIALTGLSTATNAVITASDTVIGALGKLQKQISDHLSDSADAHAASAVSNTPAGNISATTVQAAINELDSEKVGKTGAQSMTGVLTAGGLLSSAGGVGYGPGAGGTVTQDSADPRGKSTPVTLNKPSGKIFMHNETLAAGATVTFTLINSLMTHADGVVLNIAGGSSAPPNTYRLNEYTGNSGMVLISLTNQSAGPSSEAPVVSFQVLKGATS